MKAPGMVSRLDDAINPIVVKELRQAVRSKFVVAVVLLFLIIQIVYLGLHLTFVGLGGRLEAIDYQAGRDVFTALQVILLATCMLFLPAYTAVRLAAERSEVNTDLLFITTLQPRKIISGKLASAVVLAVMIFSACAPFMAFTYFLRGIDLPTIFFVLAIDFLVVIGSVHMMVFLAVIPANRVLKAFLGVLGFGILVFIFGMTLGGTVSMVQMGYAPQFEDREFWSISATVLVAFAGHCGLFFCWAVALISAPSSNRALPMRVLLLIFAVVSGLAIGYISYSTQQEEPFQAWVMLMGEIIGLCIIIAVNERERWTPRVARTIPGNWLLRVPAFVLYSGAGGGLVFAAVLTSMLALGTWVAWATIGSVAGRGFTPLTTTFFEVVGILLLYVYCYAMTAVLVRTWLMRNLAPAFTWVVFILLLAVGSLIPWLISSLIYLGQWNYIEHFPSLLGNPGAAAFEMGERGRGLHAETFLLFVLIWAAVVTVLNVRWFFSQVGAFHPYDAGSATPLPVTLADGSSATMPLSR